MVIFGHLDMERRLRELEYLDFLEDRGLRMQDG